MHYLLIIAHDDKFAPSEHLIAAIQEWVKSMETRGIRVHGNPLRPPSEAVTVRVRDGRVAHTPGSFSSSREQICAYELIQCSSLDVAVEVASKHPMAAAATIEVRPVWSALSEG